MVVMHYLNHFWLAEDESQRDDGGCGKTDSGAPDQSKEGRSPTNSGAVRQLPVDCGRADSGAPERNGDIHDWIFATNMYECLEEGGDMVAEEGEALSEVDEGENCFSRQSWALHEGRALARLWRRPVATDWSLRPNRKFSKKHWIQLTRKVMSRADDDERPMWAELERCSGNRWRVSDWKTMGGPSRARTKLDHRGDRPMTMQGAPTFGASEGWKPSECRSTRRWGWRYWGGRRNVLRQ